RPQHPLSPYTTLFRSEELKLAQQSLPNDPLVFEILGYIDRRQGRWTESTKNLERAIELDPQNRGFLKQLADSYVCLRQYADAERDRKSTRLNSSHRTI